MLHFDGEFRSCVKYTRVPKVGLRCVKFKKDKASPDCPSLSLKGAKLKGGGRSQNYIRRNMRPCASDVAPKSRRKKPGKK